jgi:hypothetical protein
MTNPRHKIYVGLSVLAALLIAALIWLWPAPPPPEPPKAPIVVMPVQMPPPPPQPTPEQLAAAVAAELEQLRLAQDKAEAKAEADAKALAAAKAKAKAKDASVTTKKKVSYSKGDRKVTEVPVAAPAEVVNKPKEARFNMSQDGKKMTAEDFDAWMKAQGIRIVPAKPVEPPKTDDKKDDG